MPRSKSNTPNSIPSAPGHERAAAMQRYDENYFKQLTSYKLVVERDDAGIETKKVWHKMQDRREAIDIRSYALAAVESLNPNWRVIAKKLEVKQVTGESGGVADAANSKPASEASNPLPANSSPASPTTVHPVRPAYRLTRDNWRGPWRGNGFGRGGWR